MVLLSLEISERKRKGSGTATKLEKHAATNDNGENHSSQISEEKAIILTPRKKKLRAMSVPCDVSKEIASKAEDFKL